MQCYASLAPVMWHSAVILSLPWYVVLDKSTHALQVVLYFTLFSDAVPCHTHTSTSRIVFFPNVRFVFISIDSICDISLPSTGVCLLYSHPTIFIRYKSLIAQACCKVMRLLSQTMDLSTRWQRHPSTCFQTAYRGSEGARAYFLPLFSPLLRAWLTWQRSRKGHAVGERGGRHIKAICRQAWESFQLEKRMLGGYPKRSHDPTPVYHLAA